MSIAAIALLAFACTERELTGEQRMEAEETQRVERLLANISVPDVTEAPILAVLLSGSSIGAAVSDDVVFALWNDGRVVFRSSSFREPPSHRTFTIEAARAIEVRDEVAKMLSAHDPWGPAYVCDGPQDIICRGPNGLDSLGMSYFFEAMGAELSDFDLGMYFSGSEAAARRDARIAEWSVGAGRACSEAERGAVQLRAAIETRLADLVKGRADSPLIDGVRLGKR